MINRLFCFLNGGHKYIIKNILLIHSGTNKLYELECISCKKRKVKTLDSLKWVRKHTL